MKYTIQQFRDEYSSEDVCLDKVFKLSYGDLKNCLKCGENVNYKRVTSRRCYQCPKCSHQLYPCAGTIFEKSTTPLMYWFYAIFLFTVSKNGLSAKELERQLGVTYKTAWRMLKQIRILIEIDETQLSGIVELDETFVGGKNKNRHKNKRFKYGKDIPIKDKVIVFGMFQRNGLVKAFAVKDRSRESLHPVIDQNIEHGSNLMTDEWRSYRGLKKRFDHDIVNHLKGQYVDGDCTTNRIENFWSVLKRTIKGSYIHVSPKYIQLYINECIFRFNNRDNKEIFNTMLSFLS